MKKALDLGCGRSKINHVGYITLGVDIREMEGVDVIHDLGSRPFPLPDDSIDFISASHLFEHFYPEQLFYCIDECWRVLKPEGYLFVAVPKAGTPAYYLHPDHKIQFMEDTFGFWQVPSEGIDRHGYLTRFWHINIVEQPHNEHIHVNMFPNKIGGKYPYKLIREKR